ncbi:hypothetical protein H6F51_20240 [Cyanobacteria bacterium FACHB-DQ100]|uniref:hypothetical protein n=1 Tax=unclassified Leptolyngbya TaxID=2650499 RepID=UPI001680F329|nr:hypothetical protein [Leptolyngbya sp. FACHB-17]MBD1824802.1 hypothetical protein [Cyanobacteria bacterium FACHB-DQ100]MBD2078921.1 hypothetical protein [Leptolyngbya sp. FACHB-17]
MNWFISFEQLGDLAMARPDPPYFLLFVGFFIAVTSAIPFVALVRERIDYWSKHFSASDLPFRGAVQIILPLTGMMSGIYILTASGLEVLGVPVLPALFFSLLFILLLSYLTWLQLGRLLSQRAVSHYLHENQDFPNHDRGVSSAAR